MGISSVGSFPVWSGGSPLLFFKLFRCRNLALNRVFPTFLRGRHVFYTWRCFNVPLHSYAPHVHMPPYICMPPGVYTTPICPYTPLCICMLSEASACCEGCKGTPYMLDTSVTPPPVWGCLPSCYTRHSFVGFPVHRYVSGISVCHMGIFLSLSQFSCIKKIGQSYVCWAVGP